MSPGDVVDFVVIGAGMAGASVGAALAQGGARIVVLEMEDRPGYHTTGRSAALHSEMYGNAVIRALTRASRGFYLADRPTPFATPRGCLHIARADQMEALEAFAATGDVKANSVWLSAKEALLRCPALRADYVVSALAENNAYDLDVDQIHQHYLRAIRSAGGRILCGEKLIEAEHAAGLWRARTANALFAAPVLINAAGAWGDVVARMAGVEPVGLSPRRRTALTVDAPEGRMIRDWPAVIDIGDQFYFKPDAGRILMSPADETPSEPCDAYPDDYDVALAVSRVQEAADIRVVRILSRWAGLRTFAIDRTPVVGFDPVAQGFFWLVGQGGYGIQTAPAMGSLAAALARGASVPAPLADEGVEAGALSPARLRAAAAVS